MPQLEQDNTVEGHLITLEGIDGSGKTTVWETLTPDYLDYPSESVEFTREPTDSAPGELLRDILANDNSDPWTELFLFMADHGTHLNNTIRPNIEDGNLVICDRYIDSRCVYQGQTLDGLIPDPLPFVHNLHSSWSKFPDLTIYLDLDVETAVERTFSGEKYEREDILTEIKQNYERLISLESERFVVVDATQPKETVLEDVISEINDFIE